MEMLLIEFINTLDLSLNKLLKNVGEGTGISKLTINQFRYIDAIHDLGKPTISDIAYKLKITKASVTTGINKLTQMGYVVKEQSSEDKRVFHVSLTNMSDQLIQAKYQALKEYGNFISSSLSKEEVRQFEVIITKLVNLFCHSY
jgi:DNA-binding MarR family transcriptional regulator